MFSLILSYSSFIPLLLTITSSLISFTCSLLLVGMSLPVRNIHCPGQLAVACICATTGDRPGTHALACNKLPQVG